MSLARDKIVFRRLHGAAWSETRPADVVLVIPYNHLSQICGRAHFLSRPAKFPDVECLALFRAEVYLLLLPEIRRVPIQSDPGRTNGRTSLNQCENERTN